MLQISEIVKKTEKIFDLFNGHFYSNELTRSTITVSPDGGRGAYGWCSIQATKGMDKLSLITSYAIVANPLAHLPVVS